MNIDLLMTRRGEVGLVTDKPFESQIAAIMFDATATLLSLEFKNMDTLELNIPVEERIGEHMLYASYIHLGLIEHGIIQDSQQIPLLIVNDPAGMPMNRTVPRASGSVLAFESFLKNAITGQPIHRDDLGAEESMDGVLAGLNKAILQYAPHLARQKTLEAAPQATPNMPGLGLGGGGGGGGYSGVQNAGRLNRGEDDDDGRY